MPAPPDPNHVRERTPLSPRRVAKSTPLPLPEPESDLESESAASNRSSPWLIGGLGLAAGVVTTALVFGLVVLKRKPIESDAQQPPAALTQRDSTTPQLTKPPAGDKPASDPDYKNPRPTPFDPKLVQVKIDYSAEVDSLGNAKCQFIFTAPPQVHEAMRALMSGNIAVAGRPTDRPPSVANMLRSFEVDDTPSILRDPEGEFRGKDIRLSFGEEGFVRHEDSRWARHLTHNPDVVCELLEVKDGRSVKLHILRIMGGMQFETVYRLQLPPGSRRIEILKNPYRLAYEAPAPAGAAKPDLPPIAMNVRAKPHLLAAMVKLYGSRLRESLWAARAEFRNGGEKLTEYRVRFRIAGFSDWGEWNTCDTVYPGQTVVHNYWPKLDAAKVGALTAQTTPADAEVEYEYTGPNGRVVRQTANKPTTLLGINEGVYTDVPLDRDTPWYSLFKFAPYSLPAFATSNDPVVKEVADRIRVNKLSGKSPTDSDEEALLFLEAAYDILRCNVQYEKAEGNIVDGLLLQKLKYPRDVLRGRAGTCVNTSIFYTSIAEAAGLEPFIVLIPGHAFAGVTLPKSRKFVFVETTGCGGGTPETSADFARVREAAEKEMKKAETDKLYLIVNMAVQRREGVMPPELPPPPRDALTSWGVVIPDGPLKKPPMVVADDDPTATMKFLKKEWVSREAFSKLGLEVTLKVNISNAKDVPCHFLMGVLDSKGNLVISADPAYGVGPEKTLVLLKTVVPTTNQYETEIVFYLPDNALPGGPGEHMFLLIPQGFVDGKPLVRDPPDIPLTITRR